MTKKSLTNDIKYAIAKAKKKLILAYTNDVILSEKSLLILNRKLHHLTSSLNSLKEQRQQLKANTTADQKQIHKVQTKIADKKNEISATKQGIRTAKKALAAANQAYKKTCLLQKVESVATHQLRHIQAGPKSPNKNTQPQKRNSPSTFNPLTLDLSLPVLPSIRPHNKPQSIWKPLAVKKGEKHSEYHLVESA